MTTTIHATSIQQFKALVVVMPPQQAANAQVLLHCTEPDYWMKQFTF